MKRSEIFDTILCVVCDCMEMTKGAILSPNRTNDAVMARCIIVSLGKDYGLSNKYLQQLLGFKSHNSISHLLRSFSERKRYDKHFRFYASSAAHEMDKIMSVVGQ